MRTVVFSLTLMVTVTTIVPQAGAQTTHVASQAAIDAALQERVTATEADRDRVLRLLERPEIRDLAGQVGLDLLQAKDAVATLDGDELAVLATQAQQVESALVGGQSSVTISTTMIIIGLLVLILLIVAV